MIHEVLFCLLRNPLSTNDESEFLNEIQNFLHPGEQNLLSRIMEVAKTYHKIICFVENVLYSTDIKTDNGESVRNGLYITAFCSGVKTVLKTYRDNVVELENMFLESPQLPLSYILCQTDQYKTLFHMLISVIKVIQNEKLHGCPLMGKLHRSINCGITQISDAATEIIKSINVVFYSQLCHWIINGEVIDEQKEFFICDGETADTNFLYPEQLEENQIDKKYSKFRRHPNVRNFYINWSMVPIFINEDIAESILFMGRIVWIIRNDPKRTRDVWDGKDLEYFKKIQSLESEPFKIMKFKQTIETCRLTITKYLWTVMLDEGNLINHINLIRDYYMLGRGELFHQFITETENHLKNLKSDMTASSLNYIFYEAARKIYGEKDKTYLRFELNLADTDTSSNPLYKLQINFQINWPLHILFHPKVIELYNKLFCFLLHLKKTQIDLHKLWHKHITEKHNINRRVWTLRQNLMFLVNNLQYYLQVDVIEAQFSLLLKSVENASELEDIIKVHHEFLINLLARTFILVPDISRSNKKHLLYQSVEFKAPSNIYNVVTRLLQLCDEFCVIATVWDPELTVPEIEELAEFEKRSDLLIETLLYTLYSLHEKANGQHLLQLINQLDFNKFFSINKMDQSLLL